MTTRYSRFFEDSQWTRGVIGGEEADDMEPDEDYDDESGRLCLPSEYVEKENTGYMSHWMKSEYLNQGHNEQPATFDTYRANAVDIGRNEQNPYTGRDASPVEVAKASRDLAKSLLGKNSLRSIVGQ